MQAATAFYLPRRIVGATKIRWKYRNGGTPLAGNYVLAIFDASGREVVDTGSVAFTGAASSFQERSETIAATTFEAGVYYVFIGIDTSAGSATFDGANLTVGASGGEPLGKPAPNLAVRAASGALVVPTTLLSMTDVAGLSAATAILSVPDVCLSVG
jgi:hypothetical protein